MADPHISLSSDVDSKVRNYCKLNGYKYSEGIRNLIELGLYNLEMNKKLELNSELLSKTYSKSIYIIDLVEKLYSDLEITNNSNPKDNKALQEFKMNKYTTSYNNLNFHYSTKEAVHNSTMNMFDYYADNKKKAFFMLDYFSGKIGKEKEMNIMFENGKYATKEEIEKRKKQYEKYIENSNIEKMVISFPEGYLEQSVDIKKFEKDMSKHIIPMFLKKCGYADIKNMSYQFSLHTDQDNLHFHFSFCEKKPNYKVKGSKLAYRHAGKLTQKELSFFKNEIEHYIEKEKYFTPLLKETNKELEELKKYFNPSEKNFLLRDKDDLILEDKIIRLGELLDKYSFTNNKIKFGSIKDEEIKKLTKDIKKHIFSKKDTELYISHQEFKESLNSINEYFKNIAKSNNTDIYDDSLIKNKKKYLNNYVLNAIVN